MRGIQGANLVQRGLIVADHGEFRAHLAEKLHEVVGEAVVVIDHENHGLSSSSGTAFVSNPSRWVMSSAATNSHSSLFRRMVVTDVLPRLSSCGLYPGSKSSNSAFSAVVCERMPMVSPVSLLTISSNAARIRLRTSLRDSPPGMQ